MDFGLKRSPLAACVLALALGLFGGPTPRLHRVRMSAAWVGGAYLVVLAVMLGRDAVDDLSDNVHVSRGFFGVLRVDEDEDLDGEERMRLRHGRIIHGLQYTDPELALEPTSYYGPGSGVGLAIGTHPRRKAGEPMTLGFVGLGAGTLACYVFEGDHARFYEIDPDVVALSSGSSPLFTYLRDARGEVEVAIGDARINLEREPPRGFDVLALDAFSSDAIPTHLLTVEADSWYLPDTAGVAYRLTHQKTTIVPQYLDPAQRRIGYFHNAGYFELEGEDYDGVLRTAEPDGLVPYVELVALEHQVHLDPVALRAQVMELVGRYVARRPATNPVAQLAARITADLPWLREHPDLFHAYAFGSLRQCGAWASVAAMFVRWLDDPAVAGAAEHLDAISALAKTAQFKLARVLAGRTVDLDEQLSTMAAHWHDALTTLAAAYGS